MLPGIGWPELLIIFVLLLLLFGSNRMSQIAKSLGRGLGEVRRVKEEIEEDVGIGQLRRVKQEMLQEVKDAASSVTDVVIDVKDSGKGSAESGDKAKV
jgi:sec-independent protein translocase protein TatA